MFAFKDLKPAFGFMKRVALAPDKINHHTDLSSSYNKVTFDLSTHSAEGLTDPNSNKRQLAPSRGIVNWVPHFHLRD